MKKYASYACILAAAACWGCIGLFNRPMLNAGIAPENLVVIRNLGGLAVLALFFKEKITGKKLLALALALLGCALVTGVFTGGLSLTTKGMLFGLGAAFFYALYSIFAPFGLRHYSPLAVVFWTFVFAALGALFVADWGNLVTVLSVPQNALLAAGLVLLSTVAPYILYTNGLANVESGKASIMASIEPVVGTLVGTLVFGEPISAGVFLGLACILACVYILR